MVPHPDGVEILSEQGRFLTGFAANYSSQFGEDGLIQKAFERFGTENKWCFEVGAHDGFFFSNTALLREYGWTAILIEADAETYVKLAKIASPMVFTVPRRINCRSLNVILEDKGAPPDIDLGVIDVDGQDYWVWDGLRQFRPRLVLIEYAYATNELDDSVPDPEGSGQATFKAILRLGKEKGYTALARTHCNILFCQSELFA